MELARTRDADERAHKRRKLTIEERQLLLKEYENGLIGREEYRERSQALVRDLNNNEPAAPPLKFDIV